MPDHLLLKSSGLKRFTVCRSGQH
uniref:Uncharacterized protein n=1 Tax=Anguilla anguilla TaxID=7936 RepID=A0A0E9VW70_ANGAN